MKSLSQEHEVGLLIKNQSSNQNKICPLSNNIMISGFRETFRKV